MLLGRTGRRGQLVSMVGAAILLTAFVPATSPAAGRGLSSFSAKGCREAASFFFVDPSIVDPFVPPELTVASVVGDRAELLVLTTTCSETKVGKNSAPMVFSEVGIYVENADSSPGWHYYGLWHATNHKELRRGLRRLEVNAPLVRDISFSSTTGSVDVDAQVPWQKAPYEMQVIAPARAKLFGSRPSTWWYKTSTGFVRVIYSVQPANGQSGVARFRTEAGSALAKILGTSARPADHAITVEYPDIKATVARVKL